jgi:hypothetical protein
MARQGKARHGKARQGRHGRAGHGMAGRGKARPGKAWQGRQSAAVGNAEQITGGKQWECTSGNQDQDLERMHSL